MFIAKMSPDAPRRIWTVPLALGAVLAGFVACGQSTIHVVGVMRRSSEMRPLPSVPLAGYQQLRVLVRAAPGQDAERYGSPDCDFALLEGASEGQERKNAACVPAEALNAAIGLVRQRLRSYGITVAKEPSEPCDYTVEVSVTGEAPRKPDRTLVKAVAKVLFKVREGTAARDTLTGSIDRGAATVAFESVSRNCSLKNANLNEFSASSAQPMTPDFDIVALAADAVDNVLRCYDLASFFLDARERFPKQHSD
jgi:hypothetical protein